MEKKRIGRITKYSKHQISHCKTQRARKKFGKNVKGLLHIGGKGKYCFLCFFFFLTQSKTLINWDPWGMNGIVNKNIHLYHSVFDFFFLKCVYPLSCPRKAIWGSMQMERRYRRQSWLWSNHRSSLGLLQSSFGVLLLLSHQCGVLKCGGHWLGVFLVNQGFTVKDLIKAWQDYALMKFSLKFISVQVFQTYMVLQTD